MHRIRKRLIGFFFFSSITTCFSSSPSVIVLPVDKAFSTSLFLTLVDPLHVASLGRGSSATCRDESGELEVAGASVSEFLLGTFA